MQVDIRPPALALIAALALSGCGSNPANVLNISGSTSVSPFVEHLAELFQAGHAGIAVNVQSLGSSAGIQAAMRGVAEIGMSSRDLKAEEAEKLDELVIARDALAVIVHPSNPVRNLTQVQVQEIFAGKISNWRELGGDDAGITIVAREAGSGTFSAFEELVLKGIPVTHAALRQGSNGAIRQVVAEDPHAIGYISLGIVDASVRALDIDGIKATHEAVLAGEYTFVRKFLFVWPKGKTPGPLAQQFIDYVMSEESQAEMEKLGLVRAR
jgi:phosphate transport system substrate-binding protein